jgi:transcriptional regulator with XRE-family HTH domain
MVMTKRKTPASERLTHQFGARINKLRGERQWTQRDLSNAADGLDTAYISRIESGKIEPCLGSLALLASAFGITLSELLKGL